VRRYSIEIKEYATDRQVLLTAADWTQEKLSFVIAQVMRLAGMPRGFTAPSS
jgi:hypothetical protein